jgi:G3E family GTPase
MHIIQHLDEVKPDGVENESVEQVAFADRILLNKIDLVTPEYLAEVKARLRAINSDAQIIETQQSVRSAHSGINVPIGRTLSQSNTPLTRRLSSLVFERSPSSKSTSAW